MGRGGRREGAGRPKGSSNMRERDPEMARTGRIVISCTEREKQLVRELADAAGMNISEYVLKRVIKDAETR